MVSLTTKMPVRMFSPPNTEWCQGLLWTNQTTPASGCLVPVAVLGLTLVYDALLRSSGSSDDSIDFSGTNAILGPGKRPTVPTTSACIVADMMRWSSGGGDKLDTAQSWLFWKKLTGVIADGITALTAWFVNWFHALE